MHGVYEDAEVRLALLKRGRLFLFRTKVNVNAREV
jgi:hypothetical protein